MNFEIEGQADESFHSNFHDLRGDQRLLDVAAICPNSRQSPLLPQKTDFAIRSKMR
jgi:hypothetical protein